MENKVATNVHAPQYILKAKDWAIGLTLMIGTVVAGLVFTIGLLASLPSQLVTVSSIVASGLGTVAVFALYLYLTNRPLSYIDVPDFSLRAIGIGVLTGGVLIAVQTGLTFLFISQGIGEALGPVGKMIQVRGIGFLAALIVANLLVTAPAEELLYRNGIQKLLYRSHSTTLAVIGGGLIFTLPHFLNLALSSQAEMLTGLLEIFVNGIGYGVIYAYWKRVDITIVAHGVYNGGVFVFAYLHVFGS